MGQKLNRVIAVGGVAAAATAGIVAITAVRRNPVRAERVRRTATVARMGARTSTNFVSMKARSALADDERRKELEDEFQLRSAEQVAEMLGGMKGALMKLGQMASYLDQGLPEPVRAALAELQQNAPPMAPELVDEVIRNELGGAPSEVFAEWDPVPLAAASIGQVHRAVTWDGAAVAVKVQYPGIDRSVAADLENTDFLFQVLGMLFPGMDPAPIVAELRERLIEELDYRIEADHQRMFAARYSGHPFIHVPVVFDDLCTARVLCTELVEGAPFSEVVEWPDDERQLAAECLYRFAFGGIYQLHAFNGDPHPGNYLFHPGGRITFLDFGLCKRFTPEEVEDFEDMIRAMVLERDLVRFRAVIERIGLLSPHLEVSDDDLVAYFGHFYEFVMESKEMEITPEWSSDSIRRFFDLSGPHAEIMKAANLPPSMVIVQRINMGLFALFGDLGARANWRAIAEEIWTFTDGPPSTPMGQRIAEWEQGRLGA